MIKYASGDAKMAALLLDVADVERQILECGRLPTPQERRALPLVARITLGWRLLALRASLRESGLYVVRDARQDPDTGEWIEFWHVALTRREACASVRRSSR